MKKLLSVVLAAIMTVSVFALSVVPAMAETVNSPTATTATSKKPTLMVNGVPTQSDISYTSSDTVPNVVVFTYAGEGTIVGWEDNLSDLSLVEGEDYTVAYNEDGTLTITFISETAIDEWEAGNITVNAVVEYDEDATTTTSAATTKKNDSSKAPATGMSTAVVASGVAVACAGIAVLAATKKKDAE